MTYATDHAENSDIKFQKIFTCGQGLDNSYCYSDCGYPVLFMWDKDSDWGKAEYNISFSAPMTGNYTCEINVTIGHFDCHDEGCPQPNEVTDIYLNGVYIGTTNDPYCN